MAKLSDSLTVIADAGNNVLRILDGVLSTDMTVYSVCDKDALVVHHRYNKFAAISNTTHLTTNSSNCSLLEVGEDLA